MNATVAERLSKVFSIHSAGPARQTGTKSKIVVQVLRHMSSPPTLSNPGPRSARSRLFVKRGSGAQSVSPGRRNIL